MVMMMMAEEEAVVIIVMGFCMMLMDYPIFMSTDNDSKLKFRHDTKLWLHRISRDYYVFCFMTRYIIIYIKHSKH